MTQMVTEIVRARFSSPSVQVDVSPYGDVVVLATHEQVLGGPTGQVYTGCRFPADRAYASQLAVHGQAVGNILAKRGVIGRFSMDFAAALDDDGTWRTYALEVNLRKGGTTHPYAALRNLVPGRYDPHLGQWIAADNAPRAYCSTDNLVHPGWLGLEPQKLIDTVANGTGVVLHMLSCLAIDGRFGMTAIGRTPEYAWNLYEATSSLAHQLRAH